MADLRLHGVGEGDLLILDVLGESAWMEADGTSPLPCPHLRKPAAPGPRRNKILAGVMRGLKAFIRQINTPIVINVLSPHPRYLVGPCCASCMPDWDRTKSPAKYLQILTELDKDIEFSLRKDLNARYYTLRELANSMGDGCTPMLTSWQLASTATNQTLTDQAITDIAKMVLETATSNRLKELAFSHLEKKRIKQKMKRIRMRRQSAEKAAKSKSQEDTDSDSDEEFRSDQSDSDNK